MPRVQPPAPAPATPRSQLFEVRLLPLLEPLLLGYTYGQRPRALERLDQLVHGCGEVVAAAVGVELKGDDLWHDVGEGVGHHLQVEPLHRERGHEEVERSVWTLG